MLHTSFLAEIHNIALLSSSTLSTFYTPITPFNSASLHFYILWALPHTPSLLIMWYFFLTQHLHAANQPPCGSTEYCMHEYVHTFLILHPHHTPELSLTPFLHSVGTLTHPQLADNLLLPSDSASTCCTPASLQSYRILHALVRFTLSTFYTPITPLNSASLHL